MHSDAKAPILFNMMKTNAPTFAASDARAGTLVSPLGLDPRPSAQEGGTAGKATPGTAQQWLDQTRDWIFDLDNTLYPASCNLFDQVDRRITRFISHSLGMAADEAYQLQKTYFRAYGTTLRGLMDRHGTDPKSYLRFVHDIDLSVLTPAPVLEAALAALPGRKLIYTNASTIHAERVLERLGIEAHFDAIHDIVAADYAPKPDKASLQMLLARFDITPASAVMLDDLPQNLKTAADCGLGTVLIQGSPDLPAGSPAPAVVEGIDYIVDDLTAWLTQLTVTAP